jgi:hypothetical protein
MEPGENLSALPDFFLAVSRGNFNKKSRASSYPFQKGSILLCQRILHALYIALGFDTRWVYLRYGYQLASYHHFHFHNSFPPIKANNSGLTSYALVPKTGLAPSSLAFSLLSSVAGVSKTVPHQAWLSCEAA